MLHLAYSSDNAPEQAVAFDREVIRFGSDPHCDVQLLGTSGVEISARHGAIIREADRYILLAGDDSGVWVNGKRIQRVALRGGESIRVGSAGGPEIRVLEVTAVSAPHAASTPKPLFDTERTMLIPPHQVKAMQAEDVASGAAPATAFTTPQASVLSSPRAREHEDDLNDDTIGAVPFVNSPPPVSDRHTSPTMFAEPAFTRAPMVAVAPPPMTLGGARDLGSPSYTVPPSVLESVVEQAASGISPLHVDVPDTFAKAAMKALKRPQEEVQHWLGRAQREIKKARSKNAGRSSGQTMVIMASALAGIRHSAEKRTQRSRRNLFYVLGASTVLVTILVSVILYQQRQITRLVSEKVAIDSQIQKVFDEMAAETDADRLAALEAKLQTLMGTAAEKLAQVRESSEKRAKELAQPVDPLEADIRKILRNFNAETYAIPPIFKEELQRHITVLKDSGSLRSAYARKRRYWPAIGRSLERNQLPQELGYIAFAESSFDPSAVNARSGASGMWQLMDETARNCGIEVNPPNRDDRLDPSRSSTAAGCYLSKLLIEFGQESFMLALASYNRGENGVRRALHKLAREPGGYRKRDFWHLYRLKLLPEETREYVPKVLAAAIVFGSPEKYGLEPVASAK